MLSTLLKSPVGIIAVALGFCATVAGIVVEVETGHNPTPTIAAIGSILTVGGVLGAGQAQVQKQTNGQLTAKETQIQALLTAVSQLLPHVTSDVAAKAMEPVTTQQVAGDASTHPNTTPSVVPAAASDVVVTQPLPFEDTTTEAPAFPTTPAS